MILILQILSIIINSLIFISIIRKIKYELRLVYIILLIFQVVFVFPIILEWIFGIQDFSYKSPGFNEALNDYATNIIYSIFVSVVSLALYLSEKKKMLKNHEFNIKDIKESLSNLRINRVLYIIFVIFMFLPILIALFSPSPEKYFTVYAFFQRFPDLASYSELIYHQKVLGLSGYISLVAILVTKLYSKNTRSMNLLIYFAAIATGILNGKRTLFALIIFAILSIDILKYPKGKFPIKKIIGTGLFILIIFISYSYLIDKHISNVSNVDNLRLYFFRDFDVKFSIYSLLNPDKYHILDYWGQSYLYNLFYYIPRTLWESKPYPYDIYVTATSLGYPRGTVIPWNFQTSLFGEAISNLGWFGIPISLFLITKFIKISEKSRNPLINILCLFIITFSFMNHFGTYSKYLIIWGVLIISNKIKSKKIKII